MTLTGRFINECARFAAYLRRRIEIRHTGSTYNVYQADDTVRRKGLSLVTSRPSPPRPKARRTKHKKTSRTSCYCRQQPFSSLSFDLRLPLLLLLLLPLPLLLLLLLLVRLISSVWRGHVNQYESRQPKLASKGSARVEGVRGVCYSSMILPYEDELTTVLHITNIDAPTS